MGSHDRDLGDGIGIMVTEASLHSAIRATHTATAQGCYYSRKGSGSVL